MNQKVDFTTMVPQVELFLFVFWENWRHHKEISQLTDLEKGQYIWIREIENLWKELRVVTRSGI